MNDYFEKFRTNSSAASFDEQIYIVENLRITVLTSRLIRIEKSENNIFCDKCTQTVINRKLDRTVFSIIDKGRNLSIKTKECELCIEIKSAKPVYAVIDGKKTNDFTGGNLMGTCRTLDNTAGKTKLEYGIMSKNGIAVLDDSDSLILPGDGSIIPRTDKETDKYYFIYGKDYNSALRDFYRLTGPVPLIPRFALGNWWSRYKAYTQNEYETLIKKFEDEEIPLSVATIDMDWHWVDVVNRFGKDAREKPADNSLAELFYIATNPGWTGYSWNTELFPSPDKFLNYLKSKKLKITMNLHPASGCKFYEDSYKPFCEYMGINPETRQQIHFDITDKKFIEGYFRYLHKPHEDSGVDFWWIDWQQGTKTKIKGLDPLWALNFYHYLDNEKDNRRPLILSRFAGAGSHRYPLGFSGDTHQCWAALDFQPYFTATAANIGYTWWSHDIGGHCFGKRDDELYLRWVQLGVFSPINRLHSTSNEFMGKEPWKYPESVKNAAKQALRMRKSLIPYIYTMNYISNKKGLPLCRPLYYDYPDIESAYKHPNEYFFGTELIACPITKPSDSKTALASVDVYIPEGRWTDIMSGRIYQGPLNIKLYRDDGFFPVFAKEGAIIPLDNDCISNGTELPEELNVMILRGNNKFSLYEDDGETDNYIQNEFSFTDFSCSVSGNDFAVTVNAGKKNDKFIPQNRKMTFEFYDIADASAIDVRKNGQKPKFTVIKKAGEIKVSVENIKPGDKLSVILSDIVCRENENIKELKTRFLSMIREDNTYKALKYGRYISETEMPKNENLYGPLNEINHLWQKV